MAAATTNALFVTANVGSIFEDPTSMLKIWCDEFLNTISRLTPKVIALHCQEVGGKNYERSMQHVSEFVKLLMSSEELQPFNKVRIYLDEDYSSAEHFTALGNFYFIHESIPDEHVEIFNFQEKKFECVVGKEVFSENIEDVPTKEKSKFPQEIFPECKWSRKGFMRTRWNLNGTVFDLVNIHLFHDASNFVAMESFPSVYCKNRQRALDHTLKRFHNDQYGNVPFFVFGDFNFRTDTQGVVKKLSEGLNAVKVQGSKSTDHSKLQYRDESSQQVVLTLGKKEFSHQDHQKLFLGGDSEWLREFDRESESFDDQLFEFNIDFPPSYPYVEDSEKGELYMQTRCPSWCDRVFLSSSARMLVDSTAEDSPLEYGLIGLNACMGDHKPVFLRATLIGGLGTVSCCALPAAPCTSCLSAATPLEHICRLCAEQSVEPSSFPMFAEPEQDHTGLVVPKFHRHTSPYTPDSTDTEPDLGEETCREEPFIIKNRNERRLSRFDISRKRLHITDEQYEDTEEDENLKPSAPKCFSKIPVRITDHKETNSVTRVHISKLPVPKVTSAKSDKDFSLKCKTVKQASSPASKHNLDSRLNSKKDIACSSNQGAIVTQDISFVSEPKSVDGRKLCRQMNVDENSSDSDSTSLEMEDQCPILEQRAEEPKVEIQFSLVETSPNLSPIDCESDGLLTTNEQRLGGSTTDSGVSVSPDFSVTTSPSTDGQDKIVHETISNVESNFEVGLRGEINPSSLERFSFVRRIQSASAMERKSSFPFPSSTFVETESTLSGFGGSGSDLWGMRTCRCMSDGSWRQRSSTISHSMLSSRADSRIRLISTSSHLDRSLPRLQSHHSSSDEEWFEEITNDLKEDFKTELGQSLNNDSGKVKRKAELTKRLSTHQECEKTSDPNISVEKISTIISSEGIHQESTQPVFEGQDLKLGTLHCKSTMTPPSLEQLSTLKIDDESCSVKARNQPQETKSDELIESSASEFLLRNTKELLNHDESKTAAENAALQIRRSSINSNSSKNQNSKNCKACCIVL